MRTARSKQAMAINLSLVLQAKSAGSTPESSLSTRHLPWAPRALDVRLDTASDPGEYPCHSPDRNTDCCLPEGQARRHSPTRFSGLFKVAITRYPCTAPAFVPPHRRACCQPRRKARYWACGSRLPRRDSHPLEHTALPGRTVPFMPSPFMPLVCPR